MKWMGTIWIRPCARLIRISNPQQNQTRCGSMPQRAMHLYVGMMRSGFNWFVDPGYLLVRLEDLRLADLRGDVFRLDALRDE